jgi:glutathione-independent formaldehyde dehydrogenase
MPVQSHSCRRSAVRRGISVTAAEWSPTCDGVHARRRRGPAAIEDIIVRIVKCTKGHGGGDQPAIVLNQAMEIIRPAGAIGIPGLYVTEDPGAHDKAARTGNLSLRLGLGWSKSNSFHTGQTPVLRYNHQLMMALLNGRLPIAKIVNAKAISLEDAPKGYAQFDEGIAAKFVLDPHGLLPKSA